MVVDPDELEEKCWKSLEVVLVVLICICILFDDSYSCDTICLLELNCGRP